MSNRFPTRKASCNSADPATRSSNCSGGLGTYRSAKRNALIPCALRNPGRHRIVASRASPPQAARQASLTVTAAGSRHTLSRTLLVFTERNHPVPAVQTLLTLHRCQCPQTTPLRHHDHTVSDIGIADSAEYSVSKATDQCQSSIPDQEAPSALDDPGRGALPNTGTLLRLEEH